MDSKNLDRKRLENAVDAIMDQREEYPEELFSEILEAMDADDLQRVLR